MSAPKIRKGSGLDTLTLLIPEKKTFEYILRNFVTKNYAAQKAVEMFPHVREYVLNGLKGTFDKNELIYLTEVFEMEKFPDFVPSTHALKIMIEHTEKMAHLSIKKKVEPAILLEKIDKLTDLQSIFLSEWLSTFTYLKGKAKPQNYVERLLESGA